MVFRDDAAFALGLFSAVCWALAEVPQLIVNAVQGSSEGISEGLLWLWVLSDVLDVVGCTISDTLPTMVITSWLYLIFTVLLLLQHLYLEKVKPWAKARQAKAAAEWGVGDEEEWDADLTAALRDVPPGRHPTRKVYGSLRNLSVLRLRESAVSRSASGLGRVLGNSFSHARGKRAHLLADGSVTTSASIPRTFSAAAAVLTPLGVVCWAGARAAGAGHPLLGASPLTGHHVPEGEWMGISVATWGAVCGWTMTVMFFGGRIPQVIKNYQRKSCAGLSFAMFLIVLTAATTYCASILIGCRTWAEFKPSLPFFTDAALGAVLDVVILVQFFVYGDGDASSSDGDDDAAPAPAPDAAAGASADDLKAPLLWGPGDEGGGSEAMMERADNLSVTTV